MESRKRVEARLKSRVLIAYSASYTLSRFLRSQSPPSSHCRVALAMLALAACQSPLAMSCLQHHAAPPPSHHAGALVAAGLAARSLWVKLWGPLGECQGSGPGERTASLCPLPICLGAGALFTLLSTQRHT